ncbi:MAG TPA: CRISPR-associated endonuclease Cas2 [Polyangiaceae bacterium]|nr:CRISPR-associated endonuclease Cas2 [Polyangiaceae bacterium]
MSGPGVKSARPWQQARPGETASRQDPTSELLTIVTFDVPCDKTRRKVTEFCKDSGLTRLQWSVFEGMMTRNRREELWGRLKSLLDKPDVGGRLAVYVIGAREAAWADRWSRPAGTTPPKASGGQP